MGGGSRAASGMHISDWTAAGSGRQLVGGARGGGAPRPGNGPLGGTRDVATRAVSGDAAGARSRGVSYVAEQAMGA